MSGVVRSDEAFIRNVGCDLPRGGRELGFWLRELLFVSVAKAGAKETLHERMTQSSTAALEIFASLAELVTITSRNACIGLWLIPLDKPQQRWAVLFPGVERVSFQTASAKMKAVSGFVTKTTHGSVRSQI